MSVISNFYTDMTLSGVLKQLIIHAYFILFIALHEQIGYLLYKPCYFFKRGNNNFLMLDAQSCIYLSIDWKLKKKKETFCNDIGEANFNVTILAYFVVY